MRGGGGGHVCEGGSDEGMVVLCLFLWYCYVDIRVAYVTCYVFPRRFAVYGNRVVNIRRGLFDTVFLTLGDGFVWLGGYIEDVLWRICHRLVGVIAGDPKDGPNSVPLLPTAY